jgi:hypothetical protein
MGWEKWVWLGESDGVGEVGVESGEVTKRSVGLIARPIPPLYLCICSKLPSGLARLNDGLVRKGMQISVPTHFGGWIVILWPREEKFVHTHPS